MTDEGSHVEPDAVKAFLASRGNAIVLGGPGSGKTTAALVKVNQEIACEEWLSFQQVLFLSFARSTIARVAEAANRIIESGVRNQVELTTYHAFAWKLIRTHGYLLQSDPPMRLLAPHDAAARLAEASRVARGDEAEINKEAERHRLLKEEGLLVFDFFAHLAAVLMERSNRIRRIVSRRYPLIVLDEFQDTNADEYRLVRCLAKDSRIIALGDPDQRIYQFRGADPKRIQQFMKDCSPDPFDFGQRNHRSNGTDILMFSNDLLSGENLGKKYADVHIKTYPTRRTPAQYIWIKSAVIESIRRASRVKDDWSVAVLVPTKRMMLTVSDFLAGRQIVDKQRKLPAVYHEVGVDAEGPALAGVTIGKLLGLVNQAPSRTTRILIEDLCGHIVGRKGDRPASQAESRLIDGLRIYLNGGKVRGSKRQGIVNDCTQIAERIAEMELSGDPFDDWICVRDIIERAEAEEIRAIAWDAKYLRFLRKGTQLRIKLAQLWSKQGTYEGASEAVQAAFIQEHFLSKNQEPRGVYVMTIHKAKGKEFDEVVIYEGIHADRIVRRPEEEDVVAQARLSLRVAVSRARTRVTLLTPAEKRCELI